ncbi:MAG: hypothetical protein DYH13_00760 [Alphaproteobacteria bacterium PRO2]|nr:hypothetical protein [Alphaproteobacteria bacterium PRO2]
MKATGKDVLNEFELARIKVPLNRRRVDFIAGDLDAAKTMLRVGNPDAAFEDVASAINAVRFLLKSSEDIDRDKLVKYVSSRTRSLLPKFDVRDANRIARDLATIEPSEAAAPPAAQQQHIALTR